MVSRFIHKFITFDTQNPLYFLRVVDFQSFCVYLCVQKVSGLERMSHELQTKVIHLQKERDNLQDRLLRGAPLSLAAEVERRQNLELKVCIGL